MASALLRASARRGSAFRRDVSAVVAAAAAPSGAKGPVGRRGVPRPPCPLRRLSSDTPGDQVPKPLAEEVNLLQQRIKEMNLNLDKRCLVSSTLEKLVEEKKGNSPFVQWSLRVGVVFLVVFARLCTADSPSQEA